MPPKSGYHFPGGLSREAGNQEAHKAYMQGPKGHAQGHETNPAGPMGVCHEITNIREFDACVVFEGFVFEIRT